MFAQEKDNFFTLFLLPLIGGVMYAAGFPSKLVSSSLLWGLGGILLFYSSLKLDIYFTSLKRSLLKTLFFSLGYTLLGYYWIPQTITIFGDLPLAAGIILGILFSLISLLQWPIAISLFFLVKHFIIPKSFYKTPVILHFIFLFILVLAEFYSPQQFPTHLGHQALHFSPYLPFAPYIGEIGYSAICYLFLFYLSFNLIHKKIPLFSILLITLIIPLSLALPLHYTKSKETSLHIRMVQANIGSLMKVGAERGAISSYKTVIQRYHKLSLLPTKTKLDLIIWPETAYPETLYSNLLTNSKMTPPIIKDVVTKLQAPLIMGGYDLTIQQQRSGEYNTVFYFDQQANLHSLYHKIKLIPFGEGLPFGPLNPILKKWITNISYFLAGKKYVLFPLKKYSFITPVCYEILFPTFLREYLNHVKYHPNFILNLTNDSWYGDTSEPLQHLFLAKWRALEFGLPLIRMTNTGISSITYPDGSESKRLGVYQQGVLDLHLHLTKNKPTFFQRYGIFPLLIFLLLSLLGLIYITKKNRE